MPILIIARLTFVEAIRRRILFAALVLGSAFLVLYGVGFWLIRSEIALSVQGETANIVRTGFYTFMTNAGLYAVNFLAIAMGALVSADTLAGEIGSGTIQAIVTKPIRRIEIVLGKWLGFAVLLGLYLLFMVGGVIGISSALAGYNAPNLASGLGLMYVEILLIVTITLACSSALSTLATGGVVFGLYGIAFIGGWVEQFGALLNNETAVDIGIISSLIIPSEAVWRRAAFDMTPQITQILGFSSGGPFVTLSVPSPLMIEYAIAYIAAALAFAGWNFARRDL